MRKYGIKNRHTGEYKTFTRKKLEEFCDTIGIRLNTLERAKREGRLSMTGWDLTEPQEEKEINIAIIVSDLHFCYEDKDAVDILYQVTKDMRGFVDEYIDLGDGINNNALSKYEDTEDTTYTLYEEISEYQKHMNNIKDILGDDVKYVVTEDNHFHLRKKKFLADNPAFRGLIPDLSGLFDEEVPHGKLYFPFSQNRFGCVHGVSFSDIFTKAHLNKYGRYDVICGHTHTIQTYVSPSGTDEDTARRSYGVPCMCNRMSYMNGSPSRQVSGFTVITYDRAVDSYNVEYIIVERGVAMFRGKKYISNYGG